VRLTKVNDLNAITMATRPSDPTLYVATQAGRIAAIDLAQPVTSSTLVLDLSTLVRNSGEQGFLGMAFSNDGTKLYVHYTSPAGGGTTTVAEYAATPAHPAAFGAANSGRTVFTADHSAATNHNGGSLLVGPDDDLYLGLGDGGGGNDQGGGQPVGGNGQSLGSPQGKILRIDPTPVASPAASYTIPTDNPFVGVSDARGEIWSFGLRNPFRFSFDRTTHDLWIGDVGQNAREEVDFVAAGDATNPRGKGANFGWNRREGFIATPGVSSPDVSPRIDPVFDIDHGTQPDRAIIGGYVYRGAAIPGLVGQYLYTDNQNGRIRALTRTGSSATSRDLGVAVGSPASFGEDNSGELYVLSLSSGVYKIGAP
jgi:glucose/arabinose dehydrogenase